MDRASETQPASAPAITAMSRTMANQTSPGFSSSRAARSRATAAATTRNPARAAVRVRRRWTARNRMPWLPATYSLARSREGSVRSSARAAKSRPKAARPRSSTGWSKAVMHAMVGVTRAAPYDPFVMATSQASRRRLRRDSATLPTRAFETGQPSLVASAAARKSSADMPGHGARRRSGRSTRRASRPRACRTSRLPDIEAVRRRARPGRGPRRTPWRSRPRGRRR